MKKILVIEDESEMRRNLTTILRLEKFHPLPAENGRVGLELAKKERPDLILCDVMMPELDGCGVIAALRTDAETVTIPFIFLTGVTTRKCANCPVREATAMLARSAIGAETRFSRCLKAAHEGHFYGMGVTLQEDKPPSVRFTKTYKGSNTRILSAAMSKLGVVIETEKRVFLFNNGEWLPLVESEVLTVRTFVRSKRFQNWSALRKRMAFCSQPQRTCSVSDRRTTRLRG